MEAEDRSKLIEETVISILKDSDLHTTTEFKVRVTAGRRLGLDLSDIHHKIFVRRVVESFLMSSVEDQVAQDVVPMKEVHGDATRVICKLSNKRNVAVQGFKEKNFVLIREIYQKDGKQLYTNKGINLTTEQWSSLRNNMPAIDEAIMKMQAKLRSGLIGQQNGPISNSVSAYDKSNHAHGEQNQQFPDTVTTNGEQSHHVSNSVASTSHEFVPIEINRFDGKNYQLWAPKMELLLKQLKIFYVLTDPCPTVATTHKASNNEIAEAAAERKWLNDDYMCRRNILNYLSDSLYHHYSVKAKGAKELWEELESVYLYEEFENKRSQVKKYIEFQMVDEKSILDQVQELNSIADSIGATGIFLDENFHVSTIMTKLPPSWKDFSIKLMREQHLPFCALMDLVRVEEESRNRQRQVEPSGSLHSQHANNYVARTNYTKRPGMHWKRREGEMDNNKGLFCYFCRKKGHTAKQCWNKKFDKEASEKRFQEIPSTPSVTDSNINHHRLTN